jgi:hypothetical protein
MMKHIRRKTSDNRVIDIYDDVFSQSERDFHIQYTYNSKYLLKSAFGGNFWLKDKNIFVSAFNPDELNTFNFLNTDSFSPIAENLKEFNINNCYSHVSSLASSFYFHVDNNILNSGKTLLYYVNPRWDRDWGGETLFANREGECEICVEYRPGRIVVFDADMEHKATNQRIDSDEFRCVFVIHYRK